MKKASRIQITVFIFCSLMMIATGASDALRGVFLPTLKEHFSLGSTGSSMIIMLSYVGNLIFLAIGGYFSDRTDRKKFVAVISLLWMTALLVYVLTDSLPMLMFFIMFSMGASTMLSTSVNLITPTVFVSSAFFVNIFNFIQGIGISGAQNIGGRFAESFKSWHGANLILLAMGIISLVLLMFIKFPKEEKTETKTENKGTFAVVLKNPATKYLILIFGFYFIAEHGMQNWLVTYGSEYLGFSVSKAAILLSVFFGGITIGRLIFAPIVQKLGIIKTMTVFVSLSTVLYSMGLLTGKRGIYLVCISGLSFSIIYPTLVLLVSKCCGQNLAGTATGFVIAAATLFDIAFNAFFGSLIKAVGFGIGIHVLTISMILFCVFFFVLKSKVEIKE